MPSAVSAEAITPWVSSATVGVPYRGWTIPCERKNIPPRAIAYGIRAAVSTIPLFAPSVEMRIAITTNDAPTAPIVTRPASDATSAEPTMLAGDST